MDLGAGQHQRLRRIAQLLGLPLEHRHPLLRPRRLRRGPTQRPGAGAAAAAVAGAVAPLGGDPQLVWPPLPSLRTRPRELGAEGEREDVRGALLAGILAEHLEDHRKLHVIGDAGT